jgi:hypothetical protein
MAIRYCGRVKIDCKLIPALTSSHGEQYKCNISIGGKKVATQYVGIPVYIGRSIDSPLSYDEAAHAALSFATDGRDEHGIGDVCDYSEGLGEVFAIRRQKAYRHEVGPRGGGSYR